MAKFSKSFFGVKAGEVYPTEFQVGEECPPELEAAALSSGAIGVVAVEKKTILKKPEK